MPAWADPFFVKITTILGGIAVFYLKAISKEMADCSRLIAVALSKIEDHGARIERLETHVYVAEKNRH